MSTVADRKSRRFNRRLATILSGDGVDFGLRMGANDEETLVLLKELRKTASETIALHNGRLFGVAGDSWMAEFLSPVEAVRCGVQLVKEFARANEKLEQDRRLDFRLGVHLGDVIVDGDDLFGDDVNIAARVQQVSAPGSLVVSEAVYSHVQGKTEFTFIPLGEHCLKHVEKPLQIFAVEIEAGSISRPELALPDLTTPIPGFGGRPALAVLPFTTLGAEENLAYLAEGVAEDLITRLSMLRWFPVIARSSSFTFGASTLDTRSIGKALGVRYLVSGTLRPAGEEVRLVVSLDDASSGTNLWRATFDMAPDQVFQVQDEIVSHMVCELDIEVDRAEQIRARQAANLGVWELVRRGIWHMNVFTRGDSAEARRLFEEALRREPLSSEALIQLAWWHFWDTWSSRSDKAGFIEIEHLARKALSIDPRDGRAHHLVGIAVMMRGHPQDARKSLEEAVALNPSLASAHSTIGSSYILEGIPSKAEDPLMLAIRLSPHDRYMFHFLGELAIACYMRSQWERAADFAERALKLRPGYWYARAILLASTARAGHRDRLPRLMQRFPIDVESIETQIEWLPFTDMKWNRSLISGVKQALSSKSRPRWLL